MLARLWDVPVENTLHDMMKGNPNQSITDQHQIKVFIQIEKITRPTPQPLFLRDMNMLRSSSGASFAGVVLW